MQNSGLNKKFGVLSVSGFWLIHVNTYALESALRRLLLTFILLLIFILLLKLSWPLPASFFPTLFLFLSLSLFQSCDYAVLWTLIRGQRGDTMQECKKWKKSAVNEQRSDTPGLLLFLVFSISKECHKSVIIMQSTWTGRAPVWGFIENLFKMHHT